MAKFHHCQFVIVHKLLNIGSIQQIEIKSTIYDMGPMYSAFGLFALNITVLLCAFSHLTSSF